MPAAAHLGPGREGRTPLSPATPHALGIDWGTTNLRLHLIAADGTVIASRHRPHGILSVAEGQFAATLERAAGDWLDAHAHVPVIACGMVGARQGWREAPYLECPAGLQRLACGLVEVPVRGSRLLHIVPGLSCEPEDGVPDVIRGEETKILGAMEDDAGLYCLPGTHAKWVDLAHGEVRSFRTAMTGEVFDLLARHSILGRMLDPHASFSGRAFEAGLDRARSSTDLLHQIFAVRTLRLFERLSESDATSYLSGLLIGNDVLASMSRQPGRPVTVVGEGTVCDSYAYALGALGVPSRVVAGDAAVARGLLAIARAGACLR